MRLNDQNRAEITAFSTLNPETWLGRVGFHAEEKEMVASGETFTCFRINPKNFYSDLKYSDLTLHAYCNIAESRFTVAVLQG